MLIVFFITLVFLLVTAYLDIVTTRRVIVAGAGVESNTWLVGTHPTIPRMLLKELLQSGVLITPTVICLIYHNPFAAGLLTGMAVYGVKHILGWRAGVRLLKK